MAKQPIELLFDGIEWVPIQPAPVSDSNDGIPYATHSGVLRIGDAELEVFQLSNGMRVISEESLKEFL